jgi:hypothetical protein
MGAILFFLSIIIGNYNESSCYISMGSKAFLDEEGKKIDSQDYNFIIYVQSVTYNFLKEVFDCQVPKHINKFLEL